MDRIEQLRAALKRIAKNAGHGYGGYYAVTAAEIALADDDRLAAAQDEAQNEAHEAAQTEAEVFGWNTDGSFIEVLPSWKAAK